MLLGLVVLFLPSTGIPSQWKTYVLVAAGVFLVLLGYSLRRSMYLRTIDRGNGERSNDAFVEQTGSTPTVVTEVASEDGNRE
jgi:LPXTG-motif cell wall-anchored protein